MKRSPLPRVLAAVGGIAAATWLTVDSFNPEHYFRYAHQSVQQQWTHPTAAVLFVALSTLLEAAVVYAALDERRTSPLWVRAALGLLVLGPWSLFSTVFVVHAPGFILLHALWVWGLLAVLAVIFVVSALGTLLLRLRRRPSAGPQHAG